MQMAESLDPTPRNPPVHKSVRLIHFALVAAGLSIGLILAGQSTATWSSVGSGCQVNTLQDLGYQARNVDAQVSMCQCNSLERSDMTGAAAISAAMPSMSVDRLIASRRSTCIWSTARFY